MDQRAMSWYERATTSAEDWPLERVLPLKGDHRISVVIPARNEEATVAEVVRLIRTELMDSSRLVDELIVMDSLSADRTAAHAQTAGAIVCSVADVVPECGVQAGKGEAIWKSLFVSTGDILIYIDADLTAWGTHFVTGVLGPLLKSDDVQLVRGFYDRIMDIHPSEVSLEGGRVTELVARPLLALHWPELSAVVQPLAGEWAIRRSHAERLSIPVGYGVELATLIDTLSFTGLDSIAQVDLGHRAHKHQTLHDLGAMAAELLVVADSRLHGRERERVVLAATDRSRGWSDRNVMTSQRPPALSTPQYAGHLERLGRI